MNEAVSVVIPVFGRVGGLMRAVGSALAQQGADVEVIVVDDGSPEPVDHVVANLPPQVRMLRLDQNAGPGPARNAGVEIATREAIAFLDADDEWREDKLASQLPLLRPGTAVTSDYVILSHDGARRELVRIRPRSLRDPVFAYTLNPSSLLLGRADFARVGGFPARRDCAEDWVLHARLMRARVAIANVSQPLTLYHWTSDNTTAQPAVRAAHALGALEILSAEASNPLELRRLRSVTYARLAQTEVNAGHLPRGLRYAGRAIRAPSATGLVEASRVPVAYVRGVARRRFRERR